MNHPKNTEGAPLLGAPYESVTVFLTLYIQNSKLKKGNRKVLKIYFCRVPKYLQSFVIENPLDKIFSNRHSAPQPVFVIPKHGTIARGICFPSPYHRAFVTRQPQHG
jgi:hypothetical protein